MNRTVKIWLTCFLLGFGTLGLGQNPDIKRTWHWYFGMYWDSTFSVHKGAGLDFSSGVPVADTNGRIFALEAVTAMSDTSGNLLFYSSNDTILNKNHQVMDFGYVPNGNEPDQMLTVPQPGNDSIYYFFYPEVWAKLQYAVINMNANGGLGAVISKDSVLIPNLATEKIAATYHCNGQDIWILGKERGNGPFYIWLLTDSGLVNGAVLTGISNIQLLSASGYFDFSPDGKLAATAYLGLGWPCEDTLELYEFDNCTGVLSNTITIPLNGAGYGLSFSPDNTKLYVGVYGFDCVYYVNGSIYQFDVSVYDKDSILASKTLIASSSSTGFHSFQIAPDGKIYVADMDTFASVNGFTNTDYLGVINNPNAKGLACDFQPESVYLGGRQHSFGLPKFINSWFNGIPSGIVPLFETANDDILIYPNPVKNILKIESKSGKDFNLTLYNIMGEAQINKTLRSQEQIQINMCNLSPGIYFINSYNNSLTINHKIIKQ